MVAFPGPNYESYQDKLETGDTMIKYVCPGCGKQLSELGYHMIRYRPYERRCKCGTDIRDFRREKVIENK